MNIFVLILNAVFVFSVLFIWLMLLYQFVLTIGGFLLRLKTQREDPSPRDASRLPHVSVLIPVRNEESVIGSLLRRVQNLRYPRDRLEMVVINDGSTDRTRELVEEMARADSRIRLVDIPIPESGRGKAAALNRGIKETAFDVIAVYDADNLPEEDSLAQLCHALGSDQNLAAVSGKFRAYNRNRNWLTRLINIESIAFQWIVQAGRAFFLKVCFLPGTNFVVRKAVLEELDGWDEEALTEDSELTLRIYEKGYRVRFLPLATSWEQEPEKLKTWVRQRTRWARGNNYLIAKHARRLFRFPLRITALEILNLLYLYYLFVFAILFSDILFFLSLFRIVRIRVPGPFTELWGLAFLLFIMEILIALSYEREDSVPSAGMAVLAYLTYTKFWVYVVIKSLLDEFVFRRKKIWVKTERYASPIPPPGSKP